jgi:hypothetical protein
MAAPALSEEALRDFTDELGGERVISSEAELREWRDPFSDLAADQYSWNDHAYMRFCETINDALDPQGILAPGKQGIWPRSMREGR